MLPRPATAAEYTQCQTKAAEAMMESAARVAAKAARTTEEEGAGA